MNTRYRKLLLLIPLVLLGIALLIRLRRPQNVPGIGAPATVIAFSSDGKTLVCASANDYVQMWIPEQNRWRSFYSESSSGYYGGSRSTVTRLRFAGDGKTLFAGGTLLNMGRHYSYAWEVPSRKLLFQFAEAQNSAFDVTRDGKTAAVGVQDAVVFFDLASNPRPPAKDRRVMPRPPHFRDYQGKAIPVNMPNCVAFSPDGKTVAIAGMMWNWQLAFWDVATRKIIRSGSGASRGVASSTPPTCLEWSPDGSRVAALWMDKIGIWDTKTQTAQEVPLNAAAGAPGSSAMLPTGISTTVFSLAWSSDGETLFSGGDEVRQWRASDLKMMRRFGVGGPVAVSPDGKQLATANIPRPGAPHGVWLWKL